MLCNRFKNIVLTNEPNTNISVPITKIGKLYIINLNNWPSTRQVRPGAQKARVITFSLTWNKKTKLDEWYSKFFTLPNYSASLNIMLFMFFFIFLKSKDNTKPIEIQFVQYNSNQVRNVFVHFKLFYSKLTFFHTNLNTNDIF